MMGPEIFNFRSAEIKQLSINNVPWELLLTADPTEEAIMKYLSRSECFGLYLDTPVPIGVYVLTVVEEDTVELKNIAVDLSYQGKGLGKLMIEDAIERVKKMGMVWFVVGTGNSGFYQIAFYQKCGFRITGVDRDFFVRNYPEPIFENGVQCRDMIRFSMKLQ